MRTLKYSILNFTLSLCCAMLMTNVYAQNTPADAPLSASHLNKNKTTSLIKVGDQGFINIIDNSDEPADGITITSPPDFASLRAMAEWEELQALTITWADFPAILKQIVAAARLETRVLIITDDPAGTEDYLMTTNTGGTAFSDMTNVTLINGNFNTIWMRDYGANPVYANEVDSLILVDWIYNRPRPDDDASPEYIANELGIQLYSTTEAPNDLMNTGGNYMSDGFGAAFASQLILEENDGSGDFNINYPNHSTSEIDGILQAYMGIDRYIKMSTLPYDGIHHIDMHMKLVDEQTILVGQYPDGVADGPQINANIEYVLNNFNSKWNTPYKVVRIPMPPNTNGLHPDQGASYRTYSNAVFVNKTILFPTYRLEYDSIAYRIWGEVCPGYNVVGIDCDNSGNNIISQSGAIHCITHSVGVADPLLISHQALEDTYDDLNPYSVTAYMNHRSGIASAMLYWKTDINGTYQSVAMNDMGSNEWNANIPAQAIGTHIYYYVEGQSVSGKIQVRPMPAPEGYWTFEVLGEVAVEELTTLAFVNVFPNPASAITCIELNFGFREKGTLKLFDMMGREVMNIFGGEFKPGNGKFFIDAANLNSGVYRFILQTQRGTQSYPLMVK
jgi:agmatine deiminase